ncbi:MAG: histidinol-phosphate transaminase [Deltaproteobacteria bacterium]|nr:histidinol-phosphate transaminase [Deltaproteobacteria bacterium]
MFESLVGKNIRNLFPYPPGKPIDEVQRELGVYDVVKLASNENPLGPSPKAIRAVLEVLNQSSFYPEGSCYYLRNKLVQKLNKNLLLNEEIRKDQVIFGNGTNELIELIVRTFCVPGDEVLTSEKAFIMYSLVAEAHGCDVGFSPLKDYTFDLEAIFNNITPQTKLVFIANPNNPTGTYVSQKDLQEFLEKTQEKNVMVVLDEAYCEYVEEKDYPHGIRLLSEFPHLIVLRTFSKIYGLAGFRVGYGVAHPDAISFINKVKSPFNVNNLAQKAAEAALDDEEFVLKTKAVIKEGFTYLYDAFNELGISYVKSSANFIMIDVKQDALLLHERLLRRGIILRPLTAYGLKTHFRVTVGTPVENRKLVSVLTALLK